MRILAVIPARAGSKGIPNKNIRIVNGKPLIAYCVENAIRSKYITDIVITTDSPEIELIAKYYGIGCKHRNAELCGDAVTLDAVIYDVCRDKDADYVITLQPTSPTLKTTTLDKAIQFAIDNQLETVISTVNRPHLAWVEKNGKVVPDYVERLNRQFLPKRYLETGAFVISKRSVISEKSRIGEKIEVYEIGEEEAIDVDNFQDLLSVEQVLKERHTAIVVNGNNEIGLGHVCRMLELADTFFYKPHIYYNEKITDKKVFGNTTHILIAYEDNNDLVNRLKKEEYQVVINDILDTDEKYMRQIKDIIPSPRIVNFEDLGEGRKYADLVINALYCDLDHEENTYFGEKYYLVPKLFLLYKPIEIKKNIQKVFVCFGGADPQNYTEKVLEIIKDKKYQNIDFTIVLGRAKKNAEFLMKNMQCSNMKVLFDVKNMPELMSESDFAITSRGRTCYELATLGIPTIAMAQNEREERHEFVCEKNGFWYLGRQAETSSIKEAIDRMIGSDVAERKEMQKKMLLHNLKNGRERIKNLIDSL